MTEVNRCNWNNLVQNHDPFLRHEFLLALEQSGSVSAEKGWQPKHLLVYSGGELIAAMPLYLKHHSRGEYVFDQPWADAYYQSGMEYYPKWLNAIPFTPCQGQRILVKSGEDKQQLIELLIKKIKSYSAQHQISSLHCLFPDYSQIKHLCHDMHIRTGVQFQWFNKNYQNFDDYLQAFTSRQRKKINKERRKIKEQGIQLQRLRGNEIMEQQWQVFFQFYQMTYLKRGQSAYLNIDFFRQIAESMPEQLLLVLANNGKKYVGAALSFIGQDTLYGRYWGCYEEYPSLHFEACYYQGIEYCIAHNINTFDSGAQGEHKISRGFKPINTYSAHWLQNVHFSRLIDDFLQREQKWIQEYKHNCKQLLPFKMPDQVSGHEKTNRLDWQ